MSGFANPRPFDELSASNQRSIAKKTRRKIKVPKMPHVTETGRRAQIKPTVYRKLWHNTDPKAPMKRTDKSHGRKK